MSVYNTLSKVDTSGKVEKKNGLSYLSWVFAWAETKKRYPEATYEIKMFENGLPYCFDENTGYMVFTSVTIENVTHPMWLFVMDGANKAMKNKPYTYQVKDWEESKRQNKYIGKDKNVEQCSMFDINKTIMRCLVKNLAMFGLGLNVYAGEDLPLTAELESLDIVQQWVNNGNTPQSCVDNLIGIHGVLEQAYVDSVMAMVDQNEAEKVMMTPEHCKAITDLIISADDEELMDKVLDKAKVTDFYKLEDHRFDKLYEWVKGLIL
jgi:hypothetical protein